MLTHLQIPLFRPGCFTKNGNAFWALGFEDEMSKPELPGVQARLWCEYSGEAPLPAAGDTTDTNGTVAAGGGSPAGSPAFPPRPTLNPPEPPVSTGPGQVSDIGSRFAFGWCTHMSSLF